MVVYGRIFSTSDRIYQMCYCCRKLEISLFSVYFWEAVGGRGRPCSPDWLRQISKPMRSTASHGLPLSASHGLPRPPIASASHNLSCDLSEPMREFKSVRPICEAVGGHGRLWEAESGRPWEAESGRPWEAM